MRTLAGRLEFSVQKAGDCFTLLRTVDVTPPVCEDRKLLQDARLSGITVTDIARALATMAGAKAISDFDAGLTRGYLDRAEALLELAIGFARERHRND